MTTENKKPHPEPTMQITVRMPYSMYKYVAREAELRKTSINAEMMRALTLVHIEGKG